MRNVRGRQSSPASAPTSSPTSAERARALLREAGLAATRVRVACLAFALEAVGPVSRDELARNRSEQGSAAASHPARHPMPVASSRPTRRAKSRGGAGSGRRRRTVAAGRLDRVTLYRTLRTFERAGLLRRERKGGTDLWCLASCDHDHVERPPRGGCPGHMHFECRECGRVECVKTSPARVKRAVEALFGGKGSRAAIHDLVGARVEAHGVCRDCASRAG